MRTKTFALGLIIPGLALPIVQQGCVGIDGDTCDDRHLVGCVNVDANLLDSGSLAEASPEQGDATSEPPVDSGWQCCDATTGPDAPSGSGDGAGGGEDGSPADAAGQCGDASYCGPGQGCVDTSSSVSNCGGCGKACTAPTGGSVACVNSACVSTCPPGSENCQNQCISKDSLSNCGGCGNVCPGPANGSNGTGSAQCVDAGCVLQCASGAHVCGADCLLNTDPPSTDPCIISPTYGVFVSSSGNDTTGNGTPEAPYATIGKAAAAAKTAGLLNVFACGTFTSSVTINATMDGRNLYGGFNCTSTTWTWSASTNAAVAPSSPGIAMTVTGLTTGVTFTNFEFNAMAAPANTGDSVLAVLVDSSSGVAFTNVTINAGAAAVGPSGTTETNYTSSLASSGNPASGVDQGGSIQCSCANPAAGYSGGGHGGSGDIAAPSPGAVGNSSPVDLVGAPAANQGAAETLAGGCANGGAGTAGASATGGTSTMLTVSLSASGLSQSGGTGNPGAYGSIGQGGGGGGGGFETVLSDGGTTGGGGSGGCGGCGGGYGTGGSPGGTSVALASVNSTITLSACVVSAGAGGAGGTGGAGQAGQGGGFGGTGSLPGCGGGSGGQGGEGGGGAGGAGGSSIGIAYTVQAPILTNGTHVNAGPAGGPGSAGSGGNAQPGNDGSSSTTPVLL